MFLNENAINKYTMNKKHEWVSFEISFTIIQSIKKFERYSVLLTYCVDDILATYIYQDLIDVCRFEWFFKKKVLSRCNVFLDLKSMLIMNNAFIHHSKISWLIN
jgi:hypothetical protein